MTGAAEYAAAFVEHCETLNHSDPLLIFLQRKLKTLLRTECDVDIDLLVNDQKRLTSMAGQR